MASGAIFRSESSATNHSIVSALHEVLEKLPSMMSRLAFLSNLRDLNSGLYCCPIASAASADTTFEEADSAMRRMHEEVFFLWLNCGLDQQKADLDAYFSSLHCAQEIAVRTWTDLQPYRLFVPTAAAAAERLLFFSDLRTILRLIRCQSEAVFAEGVEAFGAVEYPDLLTAGQLASLLGVSRRSVYLWVERDAIPAIKIGRQWRFVACDIRMWMWAKRAGAVARPDDGCGKALPRPVISCVLKCLGDSTLALTPREHEVLSLIGQGKTSKEIATALLISETTVNEHRKHICSKMGLHSTGELVACGIGRQTGTCRQQGLAGGCGLLPG